MPVSYQTPAIVEYREGPPIYQVCHGSRKVSAAGKLMNWMAGVAIVVTLTGCSPIAPMDISGSKADGTVVMGATVGLFGSISWEEAEAKAARRCALWGYRGASAFSGVQERCLDADCFSREVTRTYQCVD